MAKVICRYCQIKDEKSEMVKGITKTGYIHNECIPAYQEEQRCKEIDKQQWDELYEFIKSLTGALDIPPRNIKRLHEIKKSKQITYKLLLDAFKIAEDKIKWFMHSVRNGGNNADDINSYITIVLNSGLNQAYQQEKMKQKRKEDIKQSMGDYEKQEIKEIKYKKKSTSNDISAFL